MGLFDPCNPAVNAIIIYIIFILVIVIMKPNFLYDNQNEKFREFGSLPGQTYLTLPITAIIGSIVIYYIFALFCNRPSKKIRFLHKYA